MKKIALYGIGKNYEIIIKYLKRNDLEIVALFDKNKVGEQVDNRIIQSPDNISLYYFDELFVLPYKTEEIIKYLIENYAVDRNKIITLEKINKEYILGNLESKRYVMLTTNSDFLNFPYLNLTKRNDFTIRIPFNLEKRMDIRNINIQDSKIVFIVRDHCYPDLRNSDILLYLKRSFPLAKFVVVLSDMLEGEFGRFRFRGNDYVECMKRDFDLIITYHHEEARKFGITYYEQAYPFYKLSNKIEYNVLFVGHAKNRLPLLHEVYKYLKDNSISCKFIINDVPKSKEIFDDIIYNRELSYLDYLNEVSKCECLLEICQLGNESTYRYAEAVINNKKLLFNDITCLNRRYYNKDFMRYFSKYSEIDIEWLKNFNYVDYKYDGDFDPDRFLKFIENRL